MSAIDFYFEFASPYSYLASLEIEQIAQAAGRSVDWRPVEIPAVWAAHGVAGAYAALRQLKRRYIQRDAARCAHLRGIELARPTVSALGAATAKLAYWGLRQQSPTLAKPYLQCVWRRYFADGQPIAGLDDLAQAAAGIGLDAAQISAAAQWAGARAAQDQCNADAVASGCFGIPWLVADGEAFFGHDRLAHLAAFIAPP